MSLYEPNALVDFEKRILSVDTFAVEVNGPCSGYQGSALITMLLPLYLRVFRRDLRFANVLLLVPLGIAAMWAVNAARIALLVIIGAHASSDVAVHGFQEGWVGLLLSRSV